MNSQLSSTSSSSTGESEDIVSSDKTLVTSIPVSTNDKSMKAGRKKFKETRRPIYHGVRHKDGGKRVCEVREPCKKNRIWLETYPTSEQATLQELQRLQATRVDLCSSSSTNDGCKSEEKVIITCSRTNIVEKSSTQDYTRGLFLDEEAVFNMPVLINSMAEGMLLTPPALMKGVNWDEIGENVHDCYIDLDLW